MQEIESIKWITASQLHNILGGWQHPPFFETITKGVETKKKKTKGRPFIMYDLDQIIINHSRLCESKARARHEVFCSKLKNLKNN